MDIFFVCGAWFCVWLKVAGEKIRGIHHTSEKK